MTSKSNKIVPQIKSAEQVAQELFLKNYTDLCNRSGYQIGFRPEWKLSAETNDYRLVISMVLVPMPKQVSDQREVTSQK